MRFELAKGKENSLFSRNGGLLRFLHPTEAKLAILTVECSDYLPELRRMFPAAALYSVTVDDEAPGQPEYRNLSVAWQIIDYHAEPLPYEKEQFDYIIADRCLETATNPQDIAAGFGTFLRETGFFLTSFENIRFWKVLRQLMGGHYYAVVRRLYARPEFERLLYASFYKDAVFAPECRVAPPELLTKLTAGGFTNEQRDLETEIWFVKAARSTPEIAALKSLFTPDDRRILVTLLRRIEYGIDVAENTAAFWRFYDDMGLFPDYLAAFIHETIIYRQALYRTLITASPNRRADISATLQAAAAVVITDEDTAIVKRLLAELK